MLVFVYGSLLSGLSNHHVMAAAKGTFISVGRTMGLYHLTARGDMQYPYLTNTPLSPQQMANRIIGEVYEVDETGLKVLDELEEYPVYYNRHMVDIQKLTTASSSDTNQTSEILKCYAYFLESQSILMAIRNGFGVTYFDVLNGDWKDHLSKK